MVWSTSPGLGGLSVGRDLNFGTTVPHDAPSTVVMATCKQCIYVRVCIFFFSTDKVFRVFLTLTDQVFRDQLKDIESLEFLNLAEKLQVAVRDICINRHNLRYNKEPCS